MLFGKKKKEEKKTYDPETQVPILHCSICNGEQVAGFKDKKTGAFSEIAFIRSPQDLQAFLDAYGLTEIQKEY